MGNRPVEFGVGQIPKQAEILDRRLLVGPGSSHSTSAWYANAAPVSRPGPPSLAPWRWRSPESVRMSIALFLTPLIAVGAPALQPAPKKSGDPSLWRALTEAAQDNPTLTVLGLLLAAFVAGFGVRKLFEDRELSKLRISVSDLVAKLKAASQESDTAESRAAAEKTLGTALASHLSIRELREALSDHLNAWSADQRDLLLVGLARQLLLSPGRAWLPTPTSMVFVTVGFNPELQMSNITVRTDFQVSPLDELREIVSDVRTLNAALLHLAVYGFARVDLPTQDGTQVVVVRHDHEMNWSTVSRTYARVQNPRAR
jgi:hypothetical protein